MVFQNNLLAGVGGQGAGGLTVDNSVRYNDDDSPYLYRTPTVLGNRMRGSISLWYKRCSFGSIQQLFNAGAGNDITFNASDKLTFIDAGAAGAGTDTSYITTQEFSDPTAWGHLLFAWNTTLTTAGDRLRIYHNGVEITAFDTETNPTLNSQFQISNVVRQTIGANEGGTEEFDGYLSQFHYVDGIQNVPTDFGEFNNGVWKPIEFAADGTGLTGTVVPIMTSATAPSGVLTGGTVANGQLWSPFNNISETTAGDSYLVLQSFPTTLSYDFGSGNEKTIITYTIKNDTGDLTRAPKDWKFQGSTDNFSSSVVDLDTVTGETSWGASEIRLFSFSNTTAYRYYRLNFTASSDATYVQMDAVNYFEASSGYGTNGFFLDFAEASNLGLDAAGAAVSSTTYRYLKCDVTDVESTAYLGIGEMEYYVGTTLYPTQTMTSNTAPSPLVASANSENSAAASAWAAFDDTDSTSGGSNWLTVNGVVTGYLKIDLGDGNGIAPTRIGITAPGTQNRAPWDFTIQGSNDDSDYTVLATYASNTTWLDDETRNWPVSNGNNFADAGLAVADQMTDTPTNNVATLNPLDDFGAATLKDGNLVADGAGSTYSWILANVCFPSSGKWVCEIQRTAATYGQFGIFEKSVVTPTNSSNPATAININVGNGERFNKSVTVSPALSANDDAIWRLEYDVDTDNLEFFKAGSSVWELTTGLDVSKGLTFGVAPYDCDFTMTFNENDFDGTPTAGFKGLSTSNLPTPTIPDGTAHFQTTLYTGNGSARNIDQTGNSTFQPDLVWLKNVTDGGSNNMLFDAPRGVTKVMNSNLTAVEATDANSLTSFDADGFGLGSGAGGYNDNTKAFFAYQWLAGGGAGSANAVGSITTTTTTVNTAAGISIGTYTGTGSAATIGHGLGAVPKMIIVKERANDVGGWFMYHAQMSDDPETDYMLLNSFSALVDDSTVWNDTAPTSTVFSIGTHDDVNGSSDTYVYYAFAEVEGFSKFGSYTGNGAADGPYVYTGFKPALITYKSTASAIWPIFDSARNPLTVVASSTRQSFVNYSTSPETYGYGSDFFSSGFKLTSTDAQANGSGQLFVYWSFAEYPFGGDGVTPATTF